MQIAVRDATSEAVDVELLPFFHAAERRGRIELQELRTRVRMTPDTAYVLASQSASETTAGSGLFRWTEKNRTKESVIVLRAEVGGL